MSDKNRGPIIVGTIRAGRSVNIAENQVIINNGRDARDEAGDGEDVYISTYRNGKRTSDEEE